MKYPITPDYLAAVPEPLISLYQGLEEYIIQKICESLRISGEPNATALELIRELQRRGMPLEDIEKRIRQVLNISSKELDQIFDNAVQRNNTYYQAAYDKLGLIQEEAQLEEFAQEIETISRQTHAMMQNITRSMGFGMRGTDGQIVVSDIQETYQRILNKAEIKVLSGAESYNVAIRDGIREMTDSGLIGEWVEYRDEQGEVYHRNRVDVAVRRAVMTGVTQVSSWRAEQAAEDLETPYREISAHRGARDVDGPNGWENHKKWQGKVYSLNRGDKYPYIYTATGWGDVTGLEGANCRHMHFPFIEGFSERTYTDEELANIDKAPFTYQGRQYNAYQATQKQRQIEAALRNVKRRMVAFKASGDDEAYTAAAVRYRRLNEEYKAFSETAELPLQSERGNIPEFGPKEAKEANRAIFAAKTKAANSPVKTGTVTPLKKEHEPPIVTNTPVKPDNPVYGCKDVTQEWIDNATPNSHEVKDLTEFTQDGVTYKVDGTNVKFEYNDHEKEIAELIENKFGGDIRMMPKVNKPENIETPDYLFRGKRFDLKTLATGTSKNTVYNILAKHREQADNFVLDVTNSPLGLDEIIRQAKEVFTSKHMRWLNSVFVLNGDSFVVIFERG